MAAKVGGVIIGLRADTVQFERDMGKASRVLEKNTAAMEARMKGLEKTVATAGKVIGSALGAGLATAAFKLVQATDRMREMSDQAQRLGVSVEKLQVFRLAAAKFGADAGVADQALAALSRNVAQATQQQGALYEITKQYGIAVTDAEGRTRPLMDIYRDLADAAKRSNSATEAGRITTAAMGEEAQKLTPLLRQGADGYTAMASAFENAGDVISKSNIEFVADIKRQYDELFAQLDVQWMKWAVKVGQALKMVGMLPETPTETLDRKIADKRSEIKSLEGNRPFVYESNIQQRQDELKQLMQLRYPRSFNGAGPARVPVIDNTGGVAPEPTATGGSGRAERYRMTELEKFSRDFEPDNSDFLDKLRDDLRDFEDQVDRTREATAEATRRQTEYEDALFAEAEQVKDTLDPTRELARATARLAEMQRVGALSAEEMTAALSKMEQDALLASNSIDGIFARAGKSYTDSLTQIDWLNGNVSRQVEQAWKQAGNNIINDFLKMAMGLQPDGSGGGGGGGGFLGKLFGLGASLLGGGLDMGGAGFGMPDLGGLPVNNDFAGQLAGDMSFVGGMAEGGTLWTGQSAWVGEHGPELIEAGVTATITPTEQSMGRGGTTQVFNIRANDADSFRRSRRQIARRERMSAMVNR